MRSETTVPKLPKKHNSIFSLITQNYYCNIEVGHQPLVKVKIAFGGFV